MRTSARSKGILQSAWEKSYFDNSQAKRSRARKAGTPISTEVIPKTARIKPTREIAVIGAGFAGLCAAYELAHLGYSVSIFEARKKVGGRVKSLSDFAKKKTVEEGGELIGSNHALWNAYRMRFRLHFSDVKDYKNSPYRIKGHTLSFEQSAKLAAELDKALKAISDLAETVIDPFEPWANPDASQLDSQTITQWLNKGKFSNPCKFAVEMMLAADNGIPASEQSLLGVLAMVKGGGLDRYWLDTELYRCEGGNDSLAKAFEKSLSERGAKVKSSSPVNALRRKGSRILVEWNFEKDGRVVRGEPIEVDDVILAVPPSVWNKIDVSDFPELQDRLSDPPIMGRNVKALMRLKSRFWKDYGSSPTLSQDGRVDLTWETTEAEKSKEFVMVGFSGAKDADECLKWPEKERERRYIEDLSAVYPRLDRAIDRFKFENWPNEEWTMASYFFPRKGDVLKWGPFWTAGYEGWLHFAGEHTSFAFVGYMEGALSSGFRLARRLAVRDGLFVA